MDMHRALEGKGEAALFQNDEGPSAEQRQEPLPCWLR